MDCYRDEIRRIDEAKKPMLKHIRELNKQKKVAEHKLYLLMKELEIDEYKGIKIEKIAPRSTKRKTKKEIKEEIETILTSELCCPSEIAEKITNIKRNVNVKEVNLDCAKNYLEYILNCNKN